VGYEFPAAYPPKCPFLGLDADEKVSIADCCDADGFCFGDGSDAWCCDGRFFCTNNGPLQAAEKGGIECPIDPAREVAKIANILGLIIMGMFFLLFVTFQMCS